MKIKNYDGTARYFMCDHTVGNQVGCGNPTLEIEKFGDVGEFTCKVCKFYALIDLPCGVTNPNNSGTLCYVTPAVSKKATRCGITIK